jgi:predicted RNase H-like HicB family nuclease
VAENPSTDIMPDNNRDNRGKRPGMKYRVLIEQDEDGLYVAEVPALPGCISQGQTREGALENIREAIVAYLESLEAHDDPIPPPITEEVVDVHV